MTVRLLMLATEPCSRGAQLVTFLGMFRTALDWVRLLLLAGTYLLDAAWQEAGKVTVNTKTINV